MEARVQHLSVLFPHCNYQLYLFNTLSGQNGANWQKDVQTFMLPEKWLIYYLQLVTETASLSVKLSNQADSVWINLIKLFPFANKNETNPYKVF